MANTTLSSLGGKVCVDGLAGEVIITLIADGTCKAGWIVGQATGNGTARGVDTDGNLDELDGIALPRYDTDIDTAFTAGDLISVLIPISGRTYRVPMTDQNGSLYAGEPMTLTTVAGEVTAGADSEAVHVGRLRKNIVDNDTWCELVWGV